MRRILLPFYLALAGCMPATPADTPSRAALVETGLPPLKTFAAPQPSRVMRANSDVARDFLELSFRLESGRELPVLTRFEGPVSLRVIGAPPPGLGTDLNRLIYRLRSEAGIDISLTNAPTANITIDAIPRKEIRKYLPQAACFVVPNVSNLREYRAARRTNKVNWSQLRSRQKLAIFLPNDASPQEVRDCLHEELAQALGPLNDLYRLPDSVFNDDNVHTVLTGFDMLVLRIYYAPELQNGMTRAEVAARLPGILQRLNPAGNSAQPRRYGSTPRTWIDAIQTALGPGTAPADRVKAAERALQIAAAMGWRDHRRAFSHYAMGRLTQSRDSERAQDQFAMADQFYRNTPGTDLHRAYVAAQLAAHAISAGRGEDALQLIGPHLQTASRYENAALLSTLMMLRAEALDLTGRVAEGRAVRMDSLGWARYGFGAEWAVRAKLKEISALNPYKG